MERAESEVPVPPPLPSPGSSGGSHDRENNMEVKAEADMEVKAEAVAVEAEAVAEAMREPQNTHPREAAEAAVTMVKLANVAAHAGHEPAACLLRHGVEAAAAKITRYWSVAPRLAMPPPKMDPTAAKKCGSNINLLAHVGVVRALHGLFSKCSCSSGCPLREGSACAVHVVPPPPPSNWLETRAGKVCKGGGDEDFKPVVWWLGFTCRWILLSIRNKLHR